MPGNLFTNYFLTEGIKATAEWRTSISDSTAFAAFRNGVRQRYDALSGSEGPNEAVTEQELIRPVLELLGWADYLPQQGTTRNEDIPDYLLFTDAASKERAAGRANPEERFRDAIVVEESKRQPCHPHRPPGPSQPALPCRRRPRYLWPLGGGPNALRQPRPRPLGPR